MSGVRPPEGRKPIPLELRVKESKEEWIPPQIEDLPSESGIEQTKLVDPAASDVLMPIFHGALGGVQVSEGERAALLAPLLNALGEEALPQKFHQAVETFADGIVEQERDHYHSELEPFEVYAEKKKVNICSILEQFGQIFLAGCRHVSGREE